MLYNVIDYESGEIYLMNESSLNVSDFFIRYNCTMMPTPDFIKKENRSEADFYVLPQIEVTD